MNTSNIAPPGKAVAKPSINFFERYLTVWVALCIVAGIALVRVDSLRSAGTDPSSDLRGAVAAPAPDAPTVESLRAP